MEKCGGQSGQQLRKLKNKKADLDNLDRVEEGEGERDEDQEEGDDCQEVGDHARALLAHWKHQEKYCQSF